jgi:ACT domain-containing protein
MTDHELLESIYAELQEVKLHTRNLELSLENETNRNIRIIAEGHLDLSRKLDNALKVENEKELLFIISCKLT